MRFFYGLSLLCLTACGAPAVGVGPSDQLKGAEIAFKLEEKTSEYPSKKKEENVKLEEFFRLSTSFTEGENVGVAVAPLQKGQPAPFAGTLFSPEATATVIAELDACPKKIDAEVKKAGALKDAECNLNLANKQAEYVSLKERTDAQLRAKEQQVNLLTDELKHNSEQNVWLWAGGGVVGGALLTILTVAAVNSF